MIRSFSQVSAFQKQIMEINKPNGASGYIWRRRSDHVNYLYCDGIVIGQAKSTTNLTQMIKDHAKRKGEWFEPELIRHYFSNTEGLWRLYLNGQYCKKSRDKKELEVYVEVMSWLQQSKRGASWGKK